MYADARSKSKSILLMAALVGLGLLGLPAWSQEADSEDETQVDQEAADESDDEGTAEEENSDEALSGDEEAVSGEEEESSDDAEDADAEQSVEETESAEEAAPAEEAEEPATSSTPAPGPSKLAVERWSVTLQSPMGVRESQLTMEKPAGGAVVATISHVDGGESRTAVQLAGSNLSWAWDVTNPMPMQITCEATIQGEQMAGICTVGMFGKAPVHGSRR